MEESKSFAKEHENIWQLIKFIIVSSISGSIELVSYILLNSVILIALNAEPFSWWIFNYSGGSAGGLGTMIAFLVSTALAQVVAFIVNRKKTFKANNNVFYSAVMYIIMVVFIVCVQTYFGPLLVTGLDKIINNPDWSGVIGKLIWMLFTFCTVFPMSKYVIMRNVEEKK